MKCNYKLKITPFALFNTLVVFIIAILFYTSVMWVVSNVSLNDGLVSETYYNNEKPMIIISESMEPTIMTNSLLIVENTPYTEIKIGDIILINTAKHGLVIHRVIENSSIGFITKGDNNELPDDWVVSEEMYKGKVKEIHNEVADIITFLFGDFTQIQGIRLLIGFVILAFMITGVVIIANWLYDFIFVAFFLRKSKKKGTENLKNVYFNWVNLRTTDDDLDKTISELDIKRPFFQELLFRYRLMKWYNAMQEEEKQVRKVNKRYSKLKGVYKK